LIADKGIGKLLMIERGNRVIGAVFLRHPVGHEQCASQHVEQRQLPGEILVPGFALIGMMPVMKSR